MDFSERMDVLRWLVSVSEKKGGLSGVGRDIFLVSFRLCRVLKGVNTVHILDRLKTRETMKFKLKKRPKL